MLASWTAATQFLDTTSLVIGPLTVVRGVAWDDSPGAQSYRSWKVTNGPRRNLTIFCPQ
jgi:hypothetical protein